jgi:hypothetical protein
MSRVTIPISMDWMAYAFDVLDLQYLRNSFQPHY